MKHPLSLFLVALVIGASCIHKVQASVNDTIYVSNFNVHPNTFKSSTLQLAKAIEACKEKNAKVIKFESGRYDFRPDSSLQRELYISNTSSESECPSKIKNIGILFEGFNDVTIDGNDALFVFHSRLITMAFLNSHNIRLKNISVDFEDPSMAEMTIIECDSLSTTVRFNADSRYYLDSDSLITLYGDGWKTSVPHCIEYDPTTDHMFYSNAWNILKNSKAVETGNHIVKFLSPLSDTSVVGHTLTVRDIIRDHVGVFINDCSDIEFQNVNMGYMHGLGIVSQRTDNITFSNVNCRPLISGKRIMASSADFMHFSGCRGKISIKDCNYSGAHDDCINVHGTNLQIQKILTANKMIVRFMHPQSYGYTAYESGDSVAIVNARTLQRYFRSVVDDVKILSAREIEVTLKNNIPDNILCGSDCLENITWTPEVDIRNCVFTHTNTRGILATSPRKVVIADNIFQKIGMSAILIEGDAQGWFESGPVTDMTITGNIFYDCGYQGGPANAVIALNPSNSIVDDKAPVHENVMIEHNKFFTFGNPVLFAKSTSPLTFRFNDVTVSYPEPATLKRKDNKTYGTTPFIIRGCADVMIDSNNISGYQQAD